MANGTFYNVKLPVTLVRGGGNPSSGLAYEQMSPIKTPSGRIFYLTQITSQIITVNEYLPDTQTCVNKIVTNLSHGWNYSFYGVAYYNETSGNEELYWISTYIGAISAWAYLKVVIDKDTGAMTYSRGDVTIPVIMDTKSNAPETNYTTKYIYSVVVPYTVSSTGQDRLLFMAFQSAGGSLHLWEFTPGNTTLSKIYSDIAGATSNTSNTVLQGVVYKDNFIYFAYYNATAALILKKVDPDAPGSLATVGTIAQGGVLPSDMFGMYNFRYGNDMYFMGGYIANGANAPIVFKVSLVDATPTVLNNIPQLFGMTYQSALDLGGELLILGGFPRGSKVFDASVYKFSYFLADITDFQGTYNPGPPTSITLSWTETSDEESYYELEKRIDTGAYTKIAQIATTAAETGVTVYFSDLGYIDMIGTIEDIDINNHSYSYRLKSVKVISS